MDTTIKDYKKLVNQAFNKKEPEKKYWAVMFFNTEIELGISNQPNKWINTGNSFFTNGLSALDTYANTKNPASQIVDGETKEELANNMEEMNNNFNNINWLNENLYPYL